ncbi:tripartite tricarboxylate transporter substrate binding protein [Roseomonas xinghualingensis]|uniref:tripartite tricarboxylate transporter substrate binding protein n=1 Tax=Roseomonas xinghualingensis TaxID=2986475 RepID=UPI0021F0C14C|nr:tripartite tricarboxylate transporter substrate binding protein [Roseomonas sp. SXEYE001]MCV4207472.1 tripartite tricarboxylate transporter substrate binding protein [Roseomonas sp. SXEYE001]
MMKRRQLAALAASSMALLATRPARAAWPERPITLIVAFPAGGGTDIAARTLARFMERDLGQPIVIVNRGGAGGDIGWAEMARAQPDGYTIGFINTPNIISNPIERQTRYRLEDFAPIANLVDDPGAFFVAPDSPFRTVPDLIGYAKANPERVTYGTTGIGSDDHLAVLALERVAGVRFTHVPFSGAAPVRNALMGRQITVASMNIGEGVTDMRQGTLRALAQMAASRWAEAPDTPTFREQGFDVVQGSMRGLAAPAGVPGAALERLAGAVRATLENPEFRHLASQQALPLRYMGPEEYRASLIALRGQLQALWREHPWKE